MKMIFLLVEELNNVLADGGLKKIFRFVRCQLQETKEMFLKTVENRFDSFFSRNEIDNRIKTKLWKELEGMKCNYLCPWCGMPCCGTKNCNELYVPRGVPSTVDAEVKHSCHFHRDPAITGVGERINEVVTNRLPNNGGCPRRMEIGITRSIINPGNTGGLIIYVPYTYYDTTWRIKRTEQDPDLGSGFFWEWFLSFVSSESNMVNLKLGIYFSFKTSC